MKRFFAVVIFFFIVTMAMAQAENKILGKWQSGHGSGRIEFFKKNDQFSGKLIWLKEPNNEEGKPHTDIHNPDKKLRSRPVIGVNIFENLEYKGNLVWGGGTVYDPKSGKTYNCQISLEEPDKLHIRAYFGIALLGKTEIWTRVK